MWKHFPAPVHVTFDRIKRDIYNVNRKIMIEWARLSVGAVFVRGGVRDTYRRLLELDDVRKIKLKICR